MIVDSLIGAAIGSALYYGVRWLCAHAPKNKEDGGGFECPKCIQYIRQKQPPYCDERGGHFHFKCNACGYEWAMLPADHKPAPAASSEPRRNKWDVDPRGAS